MTLLITMFAAIFATVIWYKKAAEGKDFQLSVLCLSLWGAFLMWLVDAFFEYAELGAAYFTPAAEDMLNDAFLGFSVVALALVIWLVLFLIKDPCGVIQNILFSKKAEK